MAYGRSAAGNRMSENEPKLFIIFIYISSAYAGKQNNVLRSYCSTYSVPTPANSLDIPTFYNV